MLQTQGKKQTPFEIYHITTFWTIHIRDMGEKHIPLEIDPKIPWVDYSATIGPGGQILN